MSPLLVLVTGLFAATLFAAACAPQPSVIQATASGFGLSAAPSDVLSALQVAIAARARAADAWPAFDAGVLIAVVRPAGPVYVVGDSSLAAGYRWLDNSRAIAFREGTPPDSLLGLQIGLDWNGRIGGATAVSIPDEAHVLPLLLLHEAFHTYQKRLNRNDPRRFFNTYTRRLNRNDPQRSSGLSNPSFPESSSVHLSLLNLESTYLAQAIIASERSNLRSNALTALTALAIRMRRCALLGADECARQRMIELNEGTAAYVTSVLLDRAPVRGPPVSVRDSLARALITARDLSHFERLHYYNSGHAWLLLLEEFGPRGWKNRVELSAPDVVLTEVLGLSPNQADSIFEGSQSTAAWTAAQATARNVFSAEAARRDSIERAFWNRPGVPFRIKFGQVRSVESTKEGLADGWVEYRYNFGTNRIVIRGAAREICCPGVLTVIPTTNRTALLNGRAVSLDSVGFHDAGTLEIDLPELTLRMERASLRVYRDSVTIVSTSP